MAREASITADAVHDNENSQLEQKINTINVPRLRIQFTLRLYFARLAGRKKDMKKVLK